MASLIALSAGSTAVLDFLVLPLAQTHLPAAVATGHRLSLPCCDISFSKDTETPRKTSLAPLAFGLPEVGLQLRNLLSSFASYFFPCIPRTLAFS